MNRKAVSGIMLALLLTSVLTMTYNVQLVKADFKTVEAEKSFSADHLQFTHNGTNHNKKGNGEQARIVEHRIATAELEKLKREIGVCEEGRNYKQVINGHGTGLRPPTEEKWVEIANRIYMVERVLLNQMLQSPSSVDHTTKPYFPPIGDQDGEGSCVAWAVGYYMKTFQEAKENGWDLSGAEWEGEYPSPAYQDRIFSPDFIYHLINGGVDQGSDLYDAIDLVCAIGASSWEKMPYDPGDSASWPSENAWREAPLYRGNGGYEYLELNTNDDLENLKNLIASDNLAAITLDAYRYSNLTSEDFWTLDNYVNPSTNHANTIVGYNDNIKYWEQGEWRYGAFKIANSWGEGGWENIPDGCYWISYEAMKQRVEYCMFYSDMIDYRPELVSSFRIDHSKRGECEILIGMGDHSNPTTTKSFSDLIDGGDHPFGSNNIVFDITEFKDVVPTVINQSFFMEVYDGGVPPTYSGMYEWYSDGTSYSWFRLGRTFDIPETGATLKFWSYYEIEEDWDYGYVEVHDLDADEWYTLPGLMTVSTLPEPQDNPNCPNEFEPTVYYDTGRWNAITGFSNVTYQEEMDLTPFANHTIELYFTYWTDPFVLEKGWYIDDIEIPEIGFFDDVESGPSNWTYNGWYITNPITTGTISSFSIEYYHNYRSDSLRAESVSHDVPVNTTDWNYVFVELTLTSMHYVDVAVLEAEQMIESDPDLVILDVRTQEEYDSRHIENAVLIPVSELNDRIDELDKEKEILVYCTSGSRSATAGQILIDNGFTAVYNMLGGITAWRDAGYWIEIIDEGDLIVDGFQTLTIENCTYIQIGNIQLDDYSDLIIRNTVFKIQQDYEHQYGIAVYGNARLDIEDTVIRSELNHGMGIHDEATLKFENSTFITSSQEGHITCKGESQTVISNSTVNAIVVLEKAQTTVGSSWINHAGFRFKPPYTVELENLRPGFYDHWSFHDMQSHNVLFDLTLGNTTVESWSLEIDHTTISQFNNVRVSNSVIGSIQLNYYDIVIEVNEMKYNHFYSNWSVGSLSLTNSLVRYWSLGLSNTVASITNSDVFGLNPSGNSNISIARSTVDVYSGSYFGAMFFNNTLCEWIIVSDSDFYMSGNVNLFEPDVPLWVSSKVTRNYNVISRDTSNATMENVEVTLIDQNNTVVWNGFTDDFGEANFNLTFTDANHTYTSKLKAVKGNFSATMDVSFLSDTPVILTMRYFADLNGDGKVSMLDIAMVARAFGADYNGTDGMYWHVPSCKYCPHDPVLDVDGNGTINIGDIAKVAKDFGKTG